MEMLGPCDLPSCIHTRAIHVLLDPAGPLFLEPLGKAKDEIDWGEVTRRLTEEYISPLPIFAEPDIPVREHNTGEVCRESSVHGIHRVICGGKDPKEKHQKRRSADEFVAAIGDYVKVHRGGGGGFVRARIVALYVSPVAKFLSASVRLLKTASDIQKSEPWLEHNPPDYIPGYPHGCWWDTEEVLHHIKVTDIIEKIYVVTYYHDHYDFGMITVDMTASDWLLIGAHLLQGSYKGDGVYEEKCKCPRYDFELPQYAELGRRKKPGGDATEEGKEQLNHARHMNPKHLPVINQGFTAWADDYQTTNGRNNSTTNLAITPSNYTFPDRQRGSNIAILSLFPPKIDGQGFFRTIFWNLLEREKGMELPAAVEGGRAFVKSSLYAVLSDSPYQSKQAYAMHGRCGLCHYDERIHPLKPDLVSLL